MLPRKISEYLKNVFKIYPVVTITGPRQSGKTTLCRNLFPELPYVNFEKPDTRSFFSDDPNRFLKQYKNGAIFDEFQRVPELPSYLQVIVDEEKKNGRFILTGSNQIEIMSGVSQSLAGRTAVLKLLPLSIEEITEVFTSQNTDEILYTGFYPRIISEKLPPTVILSDYTQTYIERDVRQLTEIRNLSLFMKFLRLCAGRTGQLLNLQSLASDTGVSSVTIRQWLSILEACYIVYLLPPYFENINKRLIKSPKLYFYDTGLAAYLCGINQPGQMISHPLRGNFFENMVVVETMKFFLNRGIEPKLFFYRDSHGHEVDLLIPSANNLLALEIKSGETISGDFFQGLQYLSGIFGDRISASSLIYGGNETQNRKGSTVIPYHKTSAWLESQNAGR